MHQYDIALLELYAFGKRDLGKKDSFYADEHGLLGSDIALDLVLGFLSAADLEHTEGSLESDIFEGYDYCLHNILQKNICYGCEICANINDFLKHSRICETHPSICTLCRSTLNLFTYHLNKHGLTCGLVICEKLYLSLKRNAVENLVDYWHKIQNSILSLLYPRPITSKDLQRCFSTIGTSYDLMSARKRFITRSVNANRDSDEELVSKGPGGTSSGSDSCGSFPDPQKVDVNMISITGPMGDFNLGDPRLEIPERPSNDVSDGPGSFSNNITGFFPPNRPHEQDGCGRVINGEPRQLESLSHYWQDLKHIYRNCTESMPNSNDGVLLEGMPHELRAVDGCYQEGVHWDRLTTIGSGAHGEVWLAVDKESEGQFALKQVPLRKFQQDELTMWMKLEHDNIVQLYGAMRVNEYIYILCELYTGGSLQDYIKHNNCIDQWSATYFLQQILYALEHLKEINVLHEDLKADNVFMRAGSWKIALGDFGLSRHAPVDPGQAPIGAAMTWSPEKAGSYGHHFPSDLWAATCVYIHMLAGRPPWLRRFGNLTSLIYVIVNQSPPLQDVPSGLIDEIGNLILCGLLKDQQQRWDVEGLLNHPAFQILGLDRDDPRWTTHFMAADSSPENSTATVSDIEMTGSTEAGDLLRELTNHIVAELPAANQSEGRNYLNELIAEISSSELNTLDDQLVPSLDVQQMSEVMSSLSDIDANYSDFSVSQPTSLPLHSIPEEPRQVMETTEHPPRLHLDIQTATSGHEQRRSGPENLQRSQTVCDPGRRIERPLRRSQTSPVHPPIQEPFDMDTAGDVFMEDGDVLLGEPDIYSLDTSAGVRRDTGYGTSSPYTG